MYRIYAELHNHDVYNPEYLKLYALNEKSINLLEIPKNRPNSQQLEKLNFWDIGFFVGKKKRN